VEAASQHGTASVDADECDAGADLILERVFLDDLVSDPHKRAAHSLTVENNCGVSRQPSSFLASPDRVKGAKFLRQPSSGADGTRGGGPEESEVRLLLCA
jgi:hypothetical protein